MAQNLHLVAIVVRDYDEAIRFYVDVLGFELVDDTYQPAQDKRWVVVRPRGEGQAGLLLAKAANPRQAEAIGQQSGGRVFLFLETDDFWRDYNDYVARGVRFIREPVTEPYGTVAVFEDISGNLWDLIQRNE